VKKAYMSAVIALAAVAATVAGCGSQPTGPAQTQALQQAPSQTAPPSSTVAQVCAIQLATAEYKSPGLRQYLSHATVGNPFWLFTTTDNRCGVVALDASTGTFGLVAFYVTSSGDNIGNWSTEDSPIAETITRQAGQEGPNAQLNAQGGIVPTNNGTMGYVDHAAPTTGATCLGQAPSYGNFRVTVGQGYVPCEVAAPVLARYIGSRQQTPGWACETVNPTSASPYGTACTSWQRDVVESDAQPD
jgi:hypothetical protein